MLKNILCQQIEKFANRFYSKIIQRTMHLWRTLQCVRHAMETGSASHDLVDYVIRHVCITRVQYHYRNIGVICSSASPLAASLVTYTVRFR